MSSFHQTLKHFYSELVPILNDTSASLLAKISQSGCSALAQVK